MRARMTIAMGLAAALVWPGSARSGERADADLRVLVEDLKQEVSLLRRQVEVQKEDPARAAGAPAVGAEKGGFFLRSLDRAFDIRFRGYIQLDARWHAENDEDYIDTFLFRRVRPLVEGTLGGVVDFRIMPDFAGSSLSLQDAYLNLKYFPAANLQVGKFKAPFGIERLQSGTALSFVERALPTNLVPNRDLGYMVHGSFLEGAVGYQLAFMNGVTDGGSADTDTGDGKDFVTRVFVEPFRDASLDFLAGLGVGLAASYGWQEPGTPSVYRTSGQATFFRYRPDVTLEGHRMRVSPQLTYCWGPFGLMGEYVHTRTDLTRLGSSEQLDNDAWQVAASYVLTGENASYRGVTPSSDFAPHEGSWGAWEVAARYHELDVDGDAFELGFADPLVSAESAQAWAVGVNWYLNRWVKLMLDYERTSFTGGGGALDEDLDSESVLLVRTQLSF